VCPWRRPGRPPPRALAASNAKEVAAAIRAVVKEHIDMRLLEPGAVQ
jgi:hypothetical protein